MATESRNWAGHRSPALASFDAHCVRKDPDANATRVDPTFMNSETSSAVVFVKSVNSVHACASTVPKLMNRRM